MVYLYRRQAREIKSQFTVNSGMIKIPILNSALMFLQPDETLKILLKSTTISLLTVSTCIFHPAKGN